jgi:hypothetical protein
MPPKQQEQQRFHQTLKMVGENQTEKISTTPIPLHS